ncbi:MAG: phenylpyruvate tautomerase MIF-related protein [Coriobacteriales bacterium]|nr:phenylpyruvate tautomerase MIF-related protein [Coriobacteriales bacterium]
MPFVVARVSMPVKRAQELELKARLGHAISLVPGKSEAYLLVEIEDECHLFLAGSDVKPVAYLEVSVFGNEGHAGYDGFTREVTDAFAEVLGILPDHIYLRFSDIEAWGVAGQYIDRWMLD